MRVASNTIKTIPLSKLFDYAKSNINEFATEIGIVYRYPKSDTFFVDVAKRHLNSVITILNKNNIRVAKAIEFRQYDKKHNKFVDKVRLLLDRKVYNNKGVRVSS